MLESKELSVFIGAILILAVLCTLLVDFERKLSKVISKGSPVPNTEYYILQTYITLLALGLIFLLIYRIKESL